MNENQQKACDRCSKIFHGEAKLQTHIKMKHSKEASEDLQVPRNKCSEGELSELEDRIYAQLGQLVQNYSENLQNQNLITEDQQKFAGQANYMVNSIVRTPYEKQIEMMSEIPSNFGKKDWKAKLAKLKEETLIFHGLLEKQKDKWEFLDPLDVNSNMEEEFSLMDIPKLVKNYKKKALLANIEYPEFCIYILWLGRICKSQTWKTFYEILACNLCQYDEYLRKNSFQKSVATLVKFYNEKKKLNGNVIDDYALNYNENSLRPQDLHKMMFCYYQWVISFPILPNEKSEKQNRIQNSPEKIMQVIENAEK